MKKIINTIINTSLVLIIGTFILFLLYFYISNTYVLPWKKKEAIQTTLKWGGLKELPKGAKNLRIEKKGSMFTRQFIIKFEVEDSNSIINWIEQNKVLKNRIPEIKHNKKIYNIHEENDAFGGKVIIEDKNILINMSWS